MSYNAGEAYVRIRANSQGLKGEVEHGVRGAFRDVGKIVGGAFAIAGVADFGKHLISAAAEQQTELARVRKSIDTTNSAWIVHGKTVGDTLEGVARKTGFTVADLAHAFTRIQIGTKDSAVSLRVLNDAEDLSRATGLDLAQTSVVLSRAYQGKTQSLSRYGIIVTKVTTAEDALTAKHADAKAQIAAVDRRVKELTASGGKLSAAQRAEISLAKDQILARAGVTKAQITAAKATDAAATATGALGQVERRVGGQAGTFANTTAGQFARLHENVNQLFVSIGTDALPLIDKGVTAVSHYVDVLRGSEGVHTAFAETFHAVGEGVRVVADGLQTVGPLALDVAHAFYTVGQSIGAVPIVAFVGALKALSIASGVATAAEGAYQAVVAAGAGTRATQLTVEEAQTAAMVRFTAALEANTLALAGNVEGNVALVASEEAVGGAGVARASGGVAAFGRGLLTVAGGWKTLAAVGVGAYLYAFTRAGSAQEHNAALARETAAAFRQEREDLDGLKTSYDSLAQANLDVTQANLRVKSTQADLARTHNAYSALQRKGTEDTQAGRAALLAYQQALADAKQALLDRARAEDRAGAATTAHTAKIKAQIPDLERSLATAKKQATDAERIVFGRPHLRETHFGIFDVPTGFQGIAHREKFIDEAGVQSFARSMEGVADKASKVAAALRDVGDKSGAKAAQRTADLASNAAQFAREFGKIPKEKDITIKMEWARFRQQLAEGNRLYKYAESLADVGGRQTGETFVSGAAGAIADKAGAMAAAAAAASVGMVAAAKGAIGARSPSRLSYDEIGVPTIQGIVVAIQDGGPAVKKALSDNVGQAIQQGYQSVFDSIQQAKQNLNAIGGSLATDVGTFLDARAATATGAQPSPALARRFRHLRNLIRSGQGGEDVQREAQALAAQMQAQAAGVGAGTSAHDTALARRLARPYADLTAQLKAGTISAGDAIKTATQRQLADLSDEFNNHLISYKQYNQRVVRLLQADGINYRNAGRILGRAFADGFQADLAGVRLQARAIAQAPSVPGSGLLPNIVRPLDAIRQAQMSVAQAIKDEAAKDRSEAKKQTKHLASIDWVLTGHGSPPPGARPVGAASKQAKDAAAQGTG